MKTAVAILSVSSHHAAWRIALPLLTALVLLAISSCKDDDPDPALAAAGCRLVLLTNTVSGRYDETLTYSSVARIGYTYDDKGNETGSTVSYHYEYSDGTTAVSSGNTSRQYDDQGFLLRTITQSNQTDREKATTSSIYNTDYTYENGRLIKSTSERTSNGSPKQTSIYLYEYNSDGNFTKFTNVSNNEVTTIEYSGNKISKVTRIDAMGVSSSPFFEYNSKGLLVKWIETDGGYTEEYRYAYDDNGQVTRRERWINGKTNSADQTEYDTRESPHQHQSAQPKGHPTLPSLYSDAITKNNATRGMYYDGNGAGTGWDIRASSVSTYGYNASGFPVSATSKYFDKDGNETSNTNATFEYEACN